MELLRVNINQAQYELGTSIFEDILLFLEKWRIDWSYWPKWAGKSTPIKSVL